MSVLDSVIDPSDLAQLDPVVRERITLGVAAGARAAAAIEARQRFSPRIARSLTIIENDAVNRFNAALNVSPVNPLDPNIGPVDPIDPDVDPIDPDVGPVDPNVGP